MASDHRVLSEARRHLAQARSEVEGLQTPPSDRWSLYLEHIRTKIAHLHSARDAIDYAQREIGFDHRSLAVGKEQRLSLNETTLKGEFPHFADAITSLSDSQHCVPESLCELGGRQVSNVFYFHLRYLLQCHTYLQDVRCVCEIGGGYGAPARLWLDNPIRVPEIYVIVDFPESLFFAEVFLRTDFPDLSPLYLDEETPLSREIAERHRLVLCPIDRIHLLQHLEFDLVVNTGSLQEMTEEWVGFWMSWLDQQPCRFFYSLNYFGQPLADMREGANSWSPRLGSNWQSNLLRGCRHRSTYRCLCTYVGQRWHE